MQQFNISLKYCHGISKLDYCFDFSSGKDYVIYAQNGSMKTSLYNTIYEFKNLLPTQDVFFPKRETKRKIVDENGNDIPAKSIVCVGNNDFDLPTDNISSLLVNEKLKKRYDQIATSYDKYMKQINRVFKSISGESIDTLLLDLRIDNINLIPADMFKKENILEQFEGLKYKKFFNDDYLGNLKSESVISAVNDYIAFCNKIVDEYPIFIKDIFELHNLKSINKSAESNNYFVAGHQLLLYDKKSNEYEKYDKEKLEDLIKNIDLKIEQDENINKINQILTSKIKTQELNVFLSQNQWIIPFLNDIDNLKRMYWNYVLSSSSDLIQLIDDYKKLINSNEKELKDILKESVSEENKSAWNEAIEVFNRKFINMPFELELKNLSDVVLNINACALNYVFHDNNDSNNNVQADILKSNLSNGERKAFNILNFIFEIQYRVKNGIETFVIIDDIADSFDYKNKYAIVELLHELNNNALFHLIIMTHNFDFYRICANQLSINTNSVIKDNGINIIPFSYKRNIFSTFKDNIDKGIYFISSVPFVRNIVELTKGNLDSDYILLTSTLHYKKDTSSILLSDINSIYTRIINKKSTIKDNKYLDELFSSANNISANKVSISLENKICLSIAIRIKFEIFLFNKIGLWSIVDEFTNNQTYKMIEYCISKGLLSKQEMIIADKVRIMTSENAHVNAFMYEPIIDMSDDELITLYSEVKALK